MTNDTQNDTSITTPSDTQIRIERVFEAPRELVWEAHADPELLSEWLGPHDHPVTVTEMDLRPGGSYRWRRRPARRARSSPSTASTARSARRRSWR